MQISYTSVLRQLHKLNLQASVQLYKPWYKQTPYKADTTYKRTPVGVPKFSSHIYCKINLHSADTSVNHARKLILGHFATQKLQ